MKLSSFIATSQCTPKWNPKEFQCSPFCVLVHDFVIWVRILIALLTEDMYF
jgi:hypothetical protein